MISDLEKFHSKSVILLLLVDYILSMLCTELDFNPNIKVVDLVKYYNFT